MGIQGWSAFEKTVRYIKENYPDQFIIADAKRGDIGNTSEMYARSFFEHLDIDSVTVAPYMGEDSVKPFLVYPGKWVIVLGLTSNKGSQDFQFTADASGERLFENEELYMPIRVRILELQHVLNRRKFKNKWKPFCKKDL